MGFDDLQHARHHRLGSQALGIDVNRIVGRLQQFGMRAHGLMIDYRRLKSDLVALLLLGGCVFLALCLYSYDPAAGALRYEGALFSQGAGRPVVAGGLLYWPFEDARFSTDRAEFAVTNGVDWAWRVLPEGVVYPTLRKKYRGKKRKRRRRRR